MEGDVRQSSKRKINKKEIYEIGVFREQYIEQSIQPGLFAADSTVYRLSAAPVLPLLGALFYALCEDMMRNGEIRNSL